MKKDDDSSLLVHTGKKTGEKAGKKAKKAKKADDDDSEMFCPQDCQLSEWMVGKMCTDTCKVQLRT
jgi:hypothetical protein